MQHLDNIDEVGQGHRGGLRRHHLRRGLRPTSSSCPPPAKLKIRIRQEQSVREMMLEGVISILEGMNPRMVETKLLGYLAEAPASRRMRPRPQPA